MTKDKEWLRTRGYPMLKEVAEFWTSGEEKGANQVLYSLKRNYQPMEVANAKGDRYSAKTVQVQ